MNKAGHLAAGSGGGDKKNQEEVGQKERVQLEPCRE